LRGRRRKKKENKERKTITYHGELQINELTS